MKKSLVLMLILFSGISFSQLASNQLTFGPSGNNYPYSGFTINQYGSNITDMYWIVEPDLLNQIVLR